MRPARIVPLLALAGLWSAGCAVFQPKAPSFRSLETVREALDAASRNARPMPDRLPTRERFLLYLPNRLLDLLDVAKLSVGVGPGIGLEVYATRNVWLSYEWWRSWRVALDGRASGLYEEGHFREWHLGDRTNEAALAGRLPLAALRDMRPFERPLAPGIPAVPEVPRNDWDVGLRAHFLLFGAELLVRPYEAFDFLVGLWGDDPALDDFGLRWFPLHEYAPQSKIVEILVNGIDRMDLDTIASVLGRDLRKRSFVRHGARLMPIAPGTGAGERRSATLGGGDTLLVFGNVEFGPDRFRNDEGRLDYEVRCRGVYLRFGVPARIEYELTCYNRYTRTPERFLLSLEVEKEHWMVRRLRRAAEGM